MTARVIFSAEAGEPRVLEGTEIIEPRRLFTKEGQPVVVSERSKPQPHVIVYIRRDGAVHGKLGVIDEHQSLSGEDLQLAPSVESVGHVAGGKERE